MKSLPDHQGLSAKAMRREFFVALWDGLHVVWPVLSGLLAIMVLLGIVVALVEHWPLGNGVYFAFVTGLTIGYGDLVPKQPLSRLLAVLIGLDGVLVVGLVVAVAVQALEGALQRNP
jgi:hypothetical protein